MGHPNLSRETKFSGANGDGRKNSFPCSADHEQDWQPYPVDSDYAESADHTQIHTYIHTYIHTALWGVDEGRHEKVLRDVSCRRY